ncbi:MAG TPA: AAA family ATPase [Vicinamibacterales bacterium]|nr:AAA family ATPase [Armatimonadota bacterium]HUU33690.1 AAA family ATPase [Vicinamibacterales bacterium]
MSSGQGSTPSAQLADLYTPDVVAVLNRLAAWIDADPERSNTVVADAVGYSESTISRMLGRVYNGRVDRLAARIERFLAHERDRASAPQRPPYVRTAISDRVMRVLSLCHIEGGLGAVLGPTGIGKTMAARQYCETEPSTLYVYAGPCCRTYALLRELARLTEVHWSASGYDVLQQIIAKLSGGGRPLVVIDEADYLPEDTLHVLRQLSDGADVGVVLIGTDGFLQRLRARRTTTVNQVLGRIGHTELLDMSTEDDLHKIVEPFGLDGDAFGALVQDAHGQARRAVAALIAARRMGDGALDAKRIRKAYRKLMPVINGLPQAG